MSTERQAAEFPEFPVQFTEQDEDMLRKLEAQSAELKALYHGHYTQEAWADKSPLEQFARRRIITPLQRVPLFGRMIPAVTPADFEKHRIEVEDELREISRRQYVYGRIPEIMDEMRFLSINNPGTIEQFSKRADITGRWKDADAHFNDEELAYLVRYALALAQATPEERITGDFWGATLPTSDADYAAYFRDPKSLSPTQLLSTVAFSKNTEEIRSALRMAYPPPGDIETLAGAMRTQELEAIKTQAVAYDVPYDESNIDKTLVDISQAKYTLEGYPVLFSLEDIGENVELTVLPPDDKGSTGLVWYGDEIIGFYDDDQRAWLPFSWYTGSPLRTEEEQEEIGVARGHWNTIVNAFRAGRTMFSVAQPAIGIAILDNLTQPVLTEANFYALRDGEVELVSGWGIVYLRDSLVKAAEKAGIPIEKFTYEDFTGDERGNRVQEWIERKGKEGMDYLSEVSQRQVSEALQMLAENQLDIPPEWRVPMTQRVQDEGGGVLGVFNMIKDVPYMVNNFLEIVPSVILTAGTMVTVKTLTKNPLYAKQASGYVIGSMEAGRVYMELIDAGIPVEEAAEWTAALIPILGALEVAGSMLLFRAFAPKLYAEMMGRTFRTQLIQLTRRQLIASGVKNATQTQIAEFAIEMSVQATGNAVLAHKGVYESWTYGLDEAAFRIWFGFLPLTSMGGGAHMRHTSRYMNQAGLEGRVTQRATELINAGVPEAEAKLKATLEVLESPEGQPVRDRIEIEGRKLAEAEVDSAPIIKEIQQTEQSIAQIEFEANTLGDQVHRLQESIRRREQTIARTLDAGKRQDRMKVVSELKRQLGTLQAQQKQIKDRLAELRLTEQRQGREARRQGIITKRVWEEMAPDARRIYAREVGLPPEVVTRGWDSTPIKPTRTQWNDFWDSARSMGLARKQVHAALGVTSVKQWTNAGKSLADALKVLRNEIAVDAVLPVTEGLSVNEQAALLRDIKPTPTAEQLTTPNETLAHKTKVVERLKVINEQIAELQKKLEGEARARERADYLPELLARVEAEYAQYRQELAELIAERDALQQKLDEASLADGTTVITSQSVGDKVIRADRLTTQERMFYDAHVGAVNAHINEMAKRAGAIGSEAVDRWLVEQRATPAVEPTAIPQEGVPTPTDQLVDDNTFRQGEHPTNEHGLARLSSFEAEQATFDSAVARNPNIAESIGIRRDITLIADRALNWARVSSPPLFRKFVWGLFDTKHIFINLDTATGLPFYDLFVRFRKAVSAVTRSSELHLKKINEDAQLARIAQSEESLKRVEAILDSHRTGEGIDFTPTDGEVRFAEVVAEIFKHYEPYIRILKLEHAIEEFGYDIDAILKDLFHKDALAQEQNRADIELAVDMLRHGDTQSALGFVANLGWGVIQGYTPWMILRTELGVTRESGISARGEARLLNRNGFEMPAMDKTLMQRLDSYIHQVEAQWQLKREIKTLRNMLEHVRPKMDNEAAMYQNMSSFLREAQHMPPDGIHHPGMVTLLRLYRSMAAAVFVYPLLLTRNFMQAAVFHPYRRYLLKSMRALPVHLQNMARIVYEQEASQFKGMQRAQLMHGIKPLLADLPIVGKPYHALVRLLDRLAPYARSDDIPRHRSFNAGVIRMYEAVQAYRQHGDVDRFIRESGAEVLRTEQQNYIKKLLAVGDETVNLGLEGLQEVTGYDAVTLYNGTEIADLTHFNYERWMRPQAEHGMIGRLAFNLLTFTRSYWTRHYFNMQKIMNRELATSERLSAFRDTVGMMVIGALASAYLDDLAGRNYRSYWIGDLLSWEFGGLMIGGVAQMVGTTRELYTILDPDAEEADKTRAWGRFFSLLRQNTNILVPFARNAISLFESVTGLGEIDRRMANKVREALYAEWESSEIDRLELSFMEGFTKALYDTPPPDMLKVEEAQEIMAQKRQEIGTIDPATGHAYGIGEYGRDLAAYLKVIPSDMISRSNGFTALDEFYVDFWYWLQEFDELPTVGKARDNFRRDNIEFDTMLLFWERFTTALYTRTSPQAKQMMTTLEIWDAQYNIPASLARSRLRKYADSGLAFRD